MTVASETSSVEYAGNGVTVAFSIPFGFLSNSDIQVATRDSAGDTVTLSTGFSVTGAGTGSGTCTFTTAPASGVTVVIERFPEIIQPVDYEANDRFPAETHEGALDRQAYISQRLYRLMQASLRFPTADEAVGQAELPIASSRKGKLLYFDETDGLPEMLALADVAGTTSPLTRSLIGSTLIPRTDAEILAGVTPTNYFYPEGTVNRYGTNTTPGTTDMTTAIQAAIDVAHNGAGTARALGETYLTGAINWPGNNISLIGAGSAFAYNTSASPKTVFKAKAATSIVFDLVQTGLAEDRTGNHLADFDVDGNAIAAVGIDVAGSNILERVRVKGCTTAGVRLSNFTNGTRIVRCGLNSNSGWGLQVTGASTTTFSVTDTNTSLNTLGGIDLQAGVLVNFRNCISESNSGPGLRIYKPSSHTNAFEGFTFDNCWLEDNAATAPNFVLVIDSDTASATASPQRITFNQCRFTASVATRKYLKANACRWVEFNRCQFDNSTASDAVTGSTNAHYVSFIECTQSTGSTGITATQMDNAIAQGSYWWWWDPGVQRAVGGASPAAAFTNSWVNYDGGFQTARYWFDREGNVCIGGSIKTGTAGNSAFTLPAGYRPAAQQAFATDGNGAHALIYVNTSGTVVPNVGSSTITSLNGIKFQRTNA